MSLTTAPAAERPPQQINPRLAEDRRLLRLYHELGDMRARDELCARFMPLARQLARRYQRGHEPLDDLIQVASLGLVKAIDRYDIERGNAFSSYAVPTILGELKRYFRDSGWAVHVPRGMQERIMQVNHTTDSLSRELGRSPTPAEVGASLEMPVELVLEAQEASVAYEASSLDAPRGSGASDSDGDSYAESVGEDDEAYEQIEYIQTIAPTLSAMPERDRLVLKLRFEDDLTQSEIAARIGVSQMHVSRLIRRALTRLRTVAEAA